MTDADAIENFYRHLIAHAVERLPVRRTNCSVSPHLFVVHCTNKCSSNNNPLISFFSNPLFLRVSHASCIGGRCAHRHNVMSFAQLLKFIQLQWNAISRARRCMLDMRRTLSRAVREEAWSREKNAITLRFFLLLHRDAADAVPTSNSNQVPFFIEQVLFELRLTGKKQGTIYPPLIVSFSFHLQSIKNYLQSKVSR